MTCGKKVLFSVAGLAFCFLVLQAIPVERSNPPVTGDVPASPEVKTVLRRACYDCHSNETVWPWYSRVAPVSFLVARDVAEGREELNFSEWNLLEPEDQVEGPRDAWKMVEGGKMPMAIYLPLHPAARLSDKDKALLRSWASSFSGAAPAGENEEEDD